MVVISVYKIIKNRNSYLDSKRRAVQFTEKIENLLFIVIVTLASIGILKSLSQAIL